jgi:preprotein translocase subunit SecG
MQIWMSVILAVQLLTALGMIGLVLMQQGKGADMGASFGGGSSGSLFGATGSANFLSRSTAACATVFFICTLALASGARVGPATNNDAGSILDRAAPAASAPADVIPGGMPGVTPALAPAPATTQAVPAATEQASAPVAGVPAPISLPASPAASR